MNVEDVKFTIPGLRPYETEEDGPHWVTPEGNVVSIHHYALPPDIPHPLGQIELIRKFYRRLVAAHGALIEVENCSVSNLSGLQTILKFPMDEHGMIYVGSVTLPFVDQSYVIKIQAPEKGTTGIRDSIVAMKLGMGVANMQPPPTGLKRLFASKVEPWFQDPYDPQFWSPIMRNRSDSPEYDKDFPEHPLSQVREFLGNLSGSLTFNPDIFKLIPFPK